MKFPRVKIRAKWVIGLLLLGTLGGVGTPLVSAYWHNHDKPTFRKAEISRGEIVQWVKSTGTVKPVLSVQIGSFVSGPLKAVHVDFNDVVTKGQVLAEVDPQTYEAQLAQSNAQLESAKANLLQARAKCVQVEQEWKRAETLLPNDAISATDYDMAKFNYESAKASVASAEAAIKQYEAAVQQVKTNIGYTMITSPVDGIIIDRKVDPGQTVAAAYQTPELFRVAPDLEKRVYIYASVDEADIGLIRDAKDRDQPVMFTVDAYPDDLFEGKVYQIRLNSTVVQNVVTYSVVVEAPNAGLKLLPGMTASISFQIDRRKDVLRVPNSALRFFPAKPEQVREEDRKLVEGDDKETPDDQNAVSEIQPSAVEKAEASRKRNHRHVWIVEDDLLKAVEVVTGLNDNQYSEVVSGELSEGQSLVTGVKQ
jgi:HlyD family secretion protein